MEIVSRVAVEQVNLKPLSGQGMDWLRESRRRRMACTLETLLVTARREARSANSSASFYAGSTQSATFPEPTIASYGTPSTTS